MEVELEEQALFGGEGDPAEGDPAWTPHANKGKESDTKLCSYDIISFVTSFDVSHENEYVNGRISEGEFLGITMQYHQQ